MSGKKKNFGDKKKKKVTFTKKRKQMILIILMLIKYQFQKKNYTAQRKHVHTLLDIMIMMLLDHYV